MKYFLKTPYPCLIKTDQDSLFLEENDLLEVEDEPFLLIYPQNSMPFYINLLTPRENNFFSIISNAGQKIIYLEPPREIEVFEKEEVSIAGKNCDVVISENSLTFENGDKKITYLCPHKSPNYKVFKVKDFACVQFDHDFYAFNCKTNKLSHIQGDELAFDKDKLAVTRNFCDSDGRVRKATYKFEEELLMQEANFFKNDNTYPTDLVPYKMLESVRARDFACALKFLSENLKNSIDEERLKEFFGAVTSFLPLSTTEFITLSGNQKNFVKFEIQSDKIEDILIDEI